MGWLLAAFFVNWKGRQCFLAPALSCEHMSFGGGTQIFRPLLSFKHSAVSNSLWPRGLQHTRLPCPSPSPGACSNSHPLSQWCHPTVSSSVVPLSSCPQSFPASGSSDHSSNYIIIWGLGIDRFYTFFESPLYLCTLDEHLLIDW